MNLREIIDQLKSKGIAQCQGALWKTKDGVHMHHHRLMRSDNVGAVCMIGAVIYAQQMGWIDRHKELEILARLDQVCKPNSVEALNDIEGWTFEKFLEKYEA